MKNLIVPAVMLLAASLLSAQSAGRRPGFEWVSKQSDDSMLPGVDPLKVSGNIISAGSSTVYPPVGEDGRALQGRRPQRQRHRGLHRHRSLEQQEGTDLETSRCSLQEIARGAIQVCQRKGDAKAIAVNLVAEEGLTSR